MKDSAKDNSGVALTLAAWIRELAGGRASRSAIRIYKGVLASGYSQLISLFSQIATTPALVSAWGVELFGLWAVLSAIPSYLAVADLGFGAAGANDLAMSVSRGNLAAARRTFQSITALVFAVGVMCLVLSEGVVALLPDAWLPRAAGIGVGEVRATMAWLMAATAIGLVTSLISGPFRAVGKFALGIFVTETVRLVEVVVLICLAMLGATLASVAMACFLVRLVGLITGFWLLTRQVPWVRLGFGEAAMDEIRRLARHAAAIMVLPLAFAIGLQGMTLVVGATLGYAAVAVFVATRTMSRAVVQLVGLLAHPLLPEISSAIGRADHKRLVHLRRLMSAWLAATIPPFLVATFLFGDDIVRLWTAGRISPDHVFVLLMASAAAVHITWLSMSTFLVAANRAEAFAYWFLLSAPFCVAMGILGAKLFGLPGVAMALIVADCAMLFLVSRKVRPLIRMAAPE